ncbi:MAG: hypothetical protein IPK14_07940 [Blastocatellia bacterium]|nr:hypothetical protein [Blastocatellia bacterium]MBN8723874.1 hypothetical protein [Acidobacteriota bacterium]
MGFTEIQKTSDTRRANVDAIYRVNEKGVGILRFTKSGVENLNRMKNLDLNKPFKLYVDKDNFGLAFEQSEQGKFKIAGVNIGKYSLSYSDVSKTITQDVKYNIVNSDRYSLVLAPASDNPQIVVAVVETEEEKPAAKKRKTKK